jgi:hypothetical protein
MLGYHRVIRAILITGRMVDLFAAKAAPTVLRISVGAALAANG